MINMQEDQKQKRIYMPPVIVEIQLDNEISLVMESTPPDFESYHQVHSQSDSVNPLKLS